MNPNEEHLEKLVTELLDGHDISDVLSEICSRAYDRKSAFEMIGDRTSAAKWARIAEMLDIATSTVSQELN